MSTTRLAWIDWMKCVGMLLIVLGHTSAQNLFDPTPPFNFKQLGVAYFVFVMGYTLAREHRRTSRVLYNRAFEVYWFGGAFALLMSAVTWMRIGDLQESNYMPLAGGVNVFFNYFPANPTTWYIGLYLHLLLAWTLVRRWVPFRFWVVAAAVAVEIPLRATAIHLAGDYVAYMLLTNWLGVLLLGLWAGRPNDDHRTNHDATHVLANRSLALWCGLLAAAVLIWPLVVSSLWTVERSFPFQRLEAGGLLATLLLTSAAVTLLYLLHTWLMHQATRRLPASAAVRFFARNTLIVFIVHMPLVHALAGPLHRSIPPGLARVAADVAVFYVLPACGSEVIRRLLPPRAVREWLLETAVRLLPRTSYALRDDPG